jgi:hypothetical protein
MLAFSPFVRRNAQRVQAWARTSRELPCPLRWLVSPGNPSYTVGGHRPGGPTIAEQDGSDVRLACSYNAQPDSEAREAELGLGRQSATHMAGLDAGHWGARDT